MSKNKIMFKFATEVNAVYIKSTPKRGVYFTQVGDVVRTGKNSTDEMLYLSELHATYKEISLHFVNGGGATRTFTFPVVKLVPFKTVEEYNRHISLDMVGLGGGLDITKIPYNSLSYECGIGEMHFKREAYMEDYMLAGYRKSNWV